jgi:amidase
MGASVDILPAPFSSAALWESWKMLRSWSMAASYISYFETPHLYDLLKPAVLWEIENGLALSGLDIHNASCLRSDWYAQAARLFEEFDVLVLPSTQIWPFPAEQVHPTHINDVELDTYHRWMEVVIPASLIGLPVVNVPAGFGDAGLPFGLQLIGAKGQDAALLSIAQAWHEAKDWPNVRPPQL